jgi:ribosomal RNA-processing protein 9
MSMDCWNKDRPISSSVDRSLRLWKVAQESHLVFRGPKSIPDTVAYLTEDTFVSGDQEGSLCLWKYTQKKPIATIHHAHGMSDVYNPRWICSTQTVKMSDLAG